MARYTVVTMPGDGIGNQVLPEALRVLKAVGFDAEYVHGDIGWEFWRKEANALPDRTIDLLQETQDRPVRRHYVEAEEAARSRTDAGTSRQRPRLLQPDRDHAAAVQPGYLHEAVLGVRGQSAELCAAQYGWQDCRAADQHDRVSPEYRGALCGD